jgi:hypothetical protein
MERIPRAVRADRAGRQGEVFIAAGTGASVLAGESAARYPWTAFLQAFGGECFRSVERLIRIKVFGREDARMGP